MRSQPPFVFRVEGNNTLAACDSGISNTHGTQVAEIVMDMAPGAELLIGKVRGMFPVYDITEWMIKNDVDVIVQSAVKYCF